MAAMQDEEFDPDLLSDDLLPAYPQVGAKRNAVPLRRTPKQIERAKALAETRQREADLAEQVTTAKANAAQLAQVVNLTIAGFSFEEIGASIGASADDIERMLTKDTARFVRTQPSLRVWVRNYLSGKYTSLLEAVWDEATDKGHKEKLEHQDRALRILDRMAKLHGAEMPTQAEVKMDATPDAVNRLVQALSTSNGMGYDVSIFDTVAGEVIHEAAVLAARDEAVSGNRVEESDGEDAL